MLTEDSPESLIKQGEACLVADQPSQALTLFEQALAQRPRDSAAWRGLGKAQLDMGEPEQARASFAKALAILPYDRYAAHMLSALSAHAAADTRYVAELFDTYADQFDTHLTDTLGYRIPQLMAQLLADRDPFDSMLDLGCGTGLVGAALAPLVAAMDGIDIAPKMIRKAQQRELYRNLRTGDTLEVLARDPALSGPYDLVTAADVFVYVGPLEATFSAIADTMAPGGVFIFSVELAEQQDLILRSSGRYAHSVAYIARLADRFGFSVEQQLSRPIRQERDRPIPGHLYLLKCNR